MQSPTQNTVLREYRASRARGFLFGAPRSLTLTSEELIFGEGTEARRVALADTLRVETKGLRRSIPEAVACSIPLAWLLLVPGQPALPAYAYAWAVLLVAAIIAGLVGWTAVKVDAENGEKLTYRAWGRPKALLFLADEASFVRRTRRALRYEPVPNPARPYRIGWEIDPDKEGSPEDEEYADYECALDHLENVQDRVYAPEGSFVALHLTGVRAEIEARMEELRKMLRPRG